MKKTDYDIKISDTEKKITDHVHDKYITTPEFNTLAARVFNARLPQANLITKTLQGLNKRIISDKTKYLLIENELKKLQNFDAAYSRGKSYFDGDGIQNYLVFQPVHKYFKILSNKNS